MPETSTCMPETSNVVMADPISTAEMTDFVATAEEDTVCRRGSSRIIVIEHSYCTSDCPRKLKRKLSVIHDKYVLLRKKLKVERQKTLRLRKKVTSLQTVVDKLKNNSLVNY